MYICNRELARANRNALPLPGILLFDVMTARARCNGAYFFKWILQNSTMRLHAWKREQKKKKHNNNNNNNNKKQSQD